MAYISRLTAQSSSDMPSQVWSGTCASGTSTSCIGHLGTYSRGQLKGTLTDNAQILDGLGQLSVNLRAGSIVARVADDRQALQAASVVTTTISYTCRAIDCEFLLTRIKSPDAGQPDSDAQIRMQSMPGTSQSCFEAPVQGSQRNYPPRDHGARRRHHFSLFLSSVVTLFSTNFDLKLPF